MIAAIYKCAVKPSLLILCLLYVFEGMAAAPRSLPYPASTVLQGLTWTSEPHLYPGIHSDMHWQTWGADDAIFSVDGDGSFPGVKEYYGSLSRITGTPWGGPDHACYLPHIPAKWLDADGLGGWMLYSGDWEVTHYPKQPYYGYMTRKFRLAPKDAKDSK
jgi:hypothetical protein